MTNHYPNFVTSFMHLCADTEMPETFAAWTALSGVSAALGRRVWVDEGTYVVYPNVYVVLVAGAGRCRKSTTVGMLKRILSQVDPKINLIAQKITNEAMISHMASLSEERSNASGKVYKYSEAFVLADELSTFLNSKSYEGGIGPTLIQFFDCEKRFEYMTKTKGTDVVHNTCLGILGGTTVDWIRNAIPSDAIGGGLTSRIIFVYVDAPPPPVARVYYGDDKQALEEKLSQVLGIIRSGPSGPAELSRSAWEAYEHEYNRWHRESPFFAVPTLSGYASRRGTHIFRLGMLLSVAERPDAAQVVVEDRHVFGAVKVLEASELMMPKVLYLINATERGAMGEILASRVAGCPAGVSRELLLYSVSNRLSYREFDEIMSTLVMAGRVKRVLGPEGPVYLPVLRGARR